MKLLNSIKLFYHGSKLLKNPEGNIKSLLYVGDEVTKAKASKEAVRKLMQNRSIHHMYLWKYGLEQMDLDELSKCKKGSFGKAIYDFYATKGLDVYPMKDREDLTAEFYICERVRKVHDLLHVLLEFDTDLIGEAKVNAFVANQIKMPLSYLIMSGIMVKYFLKHPMKFQVLIDEITEGWKAAEEYQNFLSIDWDSMYDMPLDEVRRSFRNNLKKIAA